MKIGSQTFTLEVATTKAQQEKGLMYRSSMPADHGMIFAFPDDTPQPLYFWMKDTYIPLDIIFLDKVGVVVSVLQMVQYDRTERSSEHPAYYAIELNKGKAAEAGVHVGDRLQLPPAVHR